jgi:1-acyl-sn-glycerol-3-phosphate acyltransferase
MSPSRGGLTRAAVQGLCRLSVRAFFRRVEVAGAERLPPAGPVILVANHPSSLVDPMVLLAAVPRPVCFLSKEPLFRMPVLGGFLRALDAIPVYRAMDGADPRRNRATFASAQSLLRRGGVLALFPEGTSHDDPRMKPLKTGAARIALGAASNGEPLALSIVPAGLFFTDKGTFRSDALLSFGEPVAVSPAALSDAGEPLPADVRALTRRLEAALAAVVVQAEADEALRLAAAAERLFSGEEDALVERAALRRRLLAGRTRLATTDPGTLAQLERRVAAYEARAAAIEGHAPAAGGRGAWIVRGVAVAALLPAAAAGAVLHALPWLAVDHTARRVARSDRSMDATVKILAGLVFYPATWAAVGGLAALRLGALGGLAAAAGAAACGLAALAFAEAAEPLAWLARRGVLRVARGRELRRLAAEREALRADLLAVADRIERLEAGGAAGTGLE